MSECCDACRYEPIIWRGLSAANEAVRCNCGRLFFDAFPLVDQTLLHADLDQAITAQFNAIDQLLKDPSPNVRVVAVHGVARVLRIFWELIPTTAVK